MNPDAMTMLTDSWHYSAKEHGNHFTHLLLGADVVKGLSVEETGRLLSALFSKEIGHSVSVEVVTDTARFPPYSAVWGNESWAEKMRRHEALSGDAS